MSDGPTVAGIATTLRQAFPSATARQVRNALILSANPSVIPTATANDQGAGFVDAVAAYQLLLAGNVPDTVDLTHHATRNVQANMEHAGVPVHAESASVSFSGIRPSERAEVPVLVKDNTANRFRPAAFFVRTFFSRQPQRIPLWVLTFARHAQKSLHGGCGSLWKSAKNVTGKTIAERQSRT